MSHLGGAAQAAPVDSYGAFSGSVRHTVVFVLDWFDRLQLSLMKERHISGRVEHLGPAITIWLLMIAINLTIGRPAAAQVQNGIREPQEGDLVSGVVVVRGTATDDDFLRYELAFSDGGDWLVIAEGDRPVQEDTLAIWDTTVGQPEAPAFPDGVYHLRLRVVRQDRNYSEYLVRNVTVSNRTTPTPTTTATATVQAGEQAVTVQPGSTPLPEVQFGQPAPLPSLTPFPTPLPAATPPSLVQGEGTGDSGDATAAAGSGPLGRIADTDMQRFRRAFWLGAGLALCGFSLLAIYLLLRGLLRRIWRFLQSSM